VGGGTRSTPTVRARDAWARCTSSNESSRVPRGENNRWNNNAAAVTAPTVIRSDRTSQYPVSRTADRPIASAAFIVLLNHR
jgi:hypothetical protein